MPTTAKKKTFTRKAAEKPVSKKAVHTKKETMSDKPTTPETKDESATVNAPSHWEEPKATEPTPSMPETPEQPTTPSQPETPSEPETPAHEEVTKEMSEETHPVTAVPTEVHAETPTPTVTSEPVASPAPEPAAPQPTGSSFSALPSDSMGMGDTSNTATVVETKSKKGLFLGIVVVLLLLVLAGAGYYVYAKYSKMQATDTKDQAPVVAEVTPADQMVASDSASPTPASSSATAVGKLKVRVLNGTATKGLAAKVASLLEDAGFKNITTGNSDTTDAKTTTVSLGKDTDKSVFDTVKKALGSAYTVEQASSAAKTYDVDITVGQK